MKYEIKDPKGKTIWVDESQLSNYGLRAPTPTPTPTVSQQPQQEQQGARLGGVLPKLGSIGGGIIGEVAAGPFGAIPLAAAGGMAGEGLEQLLAQGKLDIPKLRAQGALSGITEGVMGPLGKLGGKLLGPLGKLFGNKLPKMFTRSALKETGAIAEKGFKASALGTGKDVGEEVVDRGIKGSAKGLTKFADQQLKSFEEKIQSSLSKIPVISTGKSIIEQGRIMTSDIVGRARMGAKEPLTNVQKFLIDSLEEAGKNVAQFGGVTKMSQLPKIQKEIADIAGLQMKKVAKYGWKSLLDLRRNADKLGKGEAASDVSSITKKVNTEVANVLRKRFAQDPEILQYAPEMASHIKEEEFFLRLMDAAITSGKRSPLGKGEMLTLLMASGGVGFGTGSPLAGLLTGVGTAGLLATPRSPLLATSLAQGLKKGTKVAGKVMEQGTRSLLQMLAPYLSNTFLKTGEASQKE